MLESKNIFLDIGRPSTLDAAGGSGLSQETETESPGQFSAVFGNAAATLKVAKSGNELPQPGDGTLAQSSVSERDQALFFSRTLKGGTALIVGGDEPTDEGLIAFARAQGMDPQALGLLAAANPPAANGDDTPALNVVPAVIQPSAQPIDADLSQLEGANLTSGFRLSAAAGLSADTGAIDQAATGQEAIAIVHQGSGLTAGQLPISGALFLANRQGPTLSHSKVSSDALNLQASNLQAANPQALKSQAQLTHKAPSVAESTIATGAITANKTGAVQITAHQLGVAEEVQIPPALMFNLNSQPIMTGLNQTTLEPKQNGLQLAAANAVQYGPNSPAVALTGVTKNLHMKAETVKEVQIAPAPMLNLKSQQITTGLNQTALEPKQNGLQLAAVNAVQYGPNSPAVALTGVTKNLHIKAETVTANGKLSAAAQSESSPQSQPEMAKLTIGPQAAEAFLKQHRVRQNLPATKTEAISLNEKLVAKLIDSQVVGASGLAVTNPAPLTTATSSSFFAATQVSAEPTDVAAELLADTAVDDPALEPLRRQDEYTQLSRQLTDALGRRLAAQIQNGSWKVEMDLHPKTLGRVEVQLEMKNGQLEAQFVAANAATRDLINEGMPRLREAFLQHGTETAYINLGTANQGFSDGNSTASGHGENGLTNGLSSAAESDSSKNDQLPSANGFDNDGLDILV